MLFMNKVELRSILEEYRKWLGIEDKIKLELKPLKTKAASISLRKGVIRLNRNLIPLLSDESIKYLILHELVHYKIGSVYHTKKFYEKVLKQFSIDSVREFEEEILKALGKLNGFQYKRYGLD